MKNHLLQLNNKIPKISLKIRIKIINFSKTIKPQNFIPKLTNFLSKNQIKHAKEKTTY